MDRWLIDDCMIDLMSNTVANYKKVIERYIKPKLGSYRLKSLTREILQSFILDMYDLGFSYNSLVSLKGVLTKSMNYAEDHHYINYPPAVRLKIPKNKERKLEEIIEKNGTSECGNGFWYFTSPKYKSYRVVEISDELANILTNARDRQLKARDYYGIFYKNYYAANPLYFDGTKPERECGINKISDDDSGYHINLICIRENGTYVSPRTMQHVSRVIKKEIFPDFDFHSLRHTHASMLLEAGAEQKYIQTRLGHSNLKITIDVYEHTTENLRSRGRAVVNKLYN